MRYSSLLAIRAGTSRIMHITPGKYTRAAWEDCVDSTLTDERSLRVSGRQVSDQANNAMDSPHLQVCKAKLLKNHPRLLEDPRVLLLPEFILVHAHHLLEGIRYDVLGRFELVFAIRPWHLCSSLCSSPAKGFMAVESYQRLVA